MSRIDFRLTEEATGWFVTGPMQMGPFCLRARAIDLAKGMIAAIQAAGDDATLIIEGHPDPLYGSSIRGDAGMAWRRQAGEGWADDAGEGPRAVAR